jgi:cytochrome c556
MKRWLACAFIVATASLAAQAPVAKVAISSDEDYSKVMKEVGAQNSALRKATATPSQAGAMPSDADAAAAAAKLETLFKDVQAYWEAKKVEDATAAAKNAVAASQAIQKAAAAHEMPAIAAASQTLGAQCMACHTAHRERQPDGSFKMK